MNDIAQELLSAWDGGQLAPSILARHPAFSWEDACGISAALTKALPINAGETWQSRYQGLPGVSGLTLRFVE